MITTDKPNPFSILALPLDATKGDIVARGNELYDTAETEDDRLLFRWAKEQLITNPQIRLEYEMFEFPDTEYEDIAWQSFVRTNRKKPVDAQILLEEASQLGIEAIDMAALLRLFLESLLTSSEADISAAIDGVRFTPIYKLPLEVRDVIFG